jgi:hypothetical protein
MESPPKMLDGTDSTGKTWTGIVNTPHGMANTSTLTAIIIDSVAQWTLRSHDLY